MKDQVFFPLRGLLFFACNGKDVVAFARKDDFGKPSPMEPFSQRLRDKPSVHSQGNLGDINTFTITCSFQTGEHEHAYVGFVGIVTPLLRAKQSMQRDGNMIDGSHHTKEVLPPNNLMISTTQPTPCPPEEFAKTVHDTVVNG